jgi:hypothetical protein
MGNGTNSSFSMNGTSDYTFAMWVNPTSLSGTSYSSMNPLMGVATSTTPGSLLLGCGSNGLYMNGYDNNGFNAIGSQLYQMSTLTHLKFQVAAWLVMVEQKVQLLILVKHLH